MPFSHSLSQCAGARLMRPRVVKAATVLVVALLGLPAAAQDDKPSEVPKSKAAAAPALEPQKPKTATAVPDPQKPRPVAAVPAAAPDSDASRYCAAVAPSIAEARIAWQTKKLAELDAQVRQRIADLEKAEASARDWLARRDEQLKAASDDVVAIYSKMQAESAAHEISAMDDRMASAILAKMKPGAAAAIFSEMEVDRASRLSAMIASGSEKKS